MQLLNLKKSAITLALLTAGYSFNVSAFDTDEVQKKSNSLC